jgi:hypothetical protein
MLTSDVLEFEGGHLGVEQNFLYGGAERDSSYD